MPLPIDLSSHKPEALCALSTAGLVALWRLFKLKSVDGDFFAAVVEALFAGALWPAACIFLFYPFYDNPPDLAHYQLYLEVGGLGLLFVSFVVIRRSLRPEREKRTTE
jgi:hypothetical protein